VPTSVAAFHSRLNHFKTYLSSLKSESDFQPTNPLKIMVSFPEPLYAHLTTEPRALMALARFSTPEKNLT
jgi:hypothetical protein